MTPLTSSQEMQDALSQAGIVAFSDHNNDGFEDANLINSCIVFATGFVGGKLAKLFTLVALATVPVIREFATIVAIRTLCTRRGNPIPESIEMRYREIVDKDGLLDQIANGQMSLYDEDGNLLVGKSFAPVMSNLVVDRRHSARKIRVKQGSSSPVITPLHRNVAGYARDGRVY
ncbi:phage protein Gp36 family protein [Pirellulaceae bacterium SH449]